MIHAFSITPMTLRGACMSFRLHILIFRNDASMGICSCISKGGLHRFSSDMFQSRCGMVQLVLILGKMFVQVDFPQPMCSYEGCCKRSTLIGQKPTVSGLCNSTLIDQSKKHKPHHQGIGTDRGCKLHRLDRHLFPFFQPP